MAMVPSLEVGQNLLGLVDGATDADVRGLADGVVLQVDDDIWKESNP